MRKWVVAALVAGLGYAMPASAQSFVGTWTATARLEGGFETSETVIVVKTANGYAITGKAINAPAGSPEAGPGIDIVIEGDKFAYKRALNIGGNGIELFYSGTVSGDRFTGIAELGGTKIPYTGVRVASGK